MVNMYSSCPVCQKVLTYVPDPHIEIKECLNGCYEASEIGAVVIFGKVFNLSLYLKFDDMKKDIEKEVGYWRENERYILKLLDRDTE